MIEVKISPLSILFASAVEFGWIYLTTPKISLDELVDLEPTYYVDLNQDGYIGNALSNALSFDIIA